MPSPAPLFLTRRYQPFILCGANGLGPGGPRMPSVAWYRLWLAEGGALDLHLAGQSAPTRVPAPCGLLQPPGERCRVTYDHVEHCRVLEFDAVHQRRQRRADGRALRHASRRPQPQPEDVWGQRLPVVVAPSYLAGLKATLVFCGDQWWRGPFARARANARLAEWLATYAGSQAAPTPAGDDWLAQCSAVATQHLYQGLTAARWAERMGLCRQHFTRRFTAAVGVGPGEYLDQLRMDEARKLLLAGGLSVKEVAWLCGFRRLSTFSRFFARLAGQSPRRWRATRTAQVT